MILDAVTAWDVDGDRVEATNLALRRLAELEGAYRVTLNDDDELSLDLSNLIGGTAVAMSRLVQLASEGQGVSREEIVSDLRGWLAQ
ncbi:MAG: hypothetical protein AAGC61_02915 [Microbacterium sp.]